MQEIRQDTGYGLIPRAIMRNKELSLQARAIYSYLASFAGNTGKAWPSVDLMVAELGITRNTFFKYLKELKEAGAVDVRKEETTDGTFGKNVYYLNNQLQPCTKKQDTAPCTKKPDTVKPDTAKPDTVNQDTNNNNLISNSIISNNTKSNSNIMSEQSTDDDKPLKYQEGSLEINIAKAMVEIILQEKPDSKVPGLEAKDLQGWATDIDRTIRIDKRDPKELIELFRWAQADDFWVANIRSPRKLREKWDTLELQRSRGNRPKNRNINNLAKAYMRAREEEESEGLFS